MGMNITRPSPEVIAALKPSLKRKNESRSQSSEDLNPLSDSSKAPPKPALKEDVVFDVNVNNFQKLVLESPVPVVLDIYADCEYRMVLSLYYFIVRLKGVDHANNLGLYWKTLP
jgi:hypothetical protein